MRGKNKTDCIEEFICYLQIDKKYSQNTIASYQEELTLFEKYIKKDFLLISKKDIVNYMCYLKDKGNQEKTIAHFVTVLRSFYRFLEIEEYIKENPTEFISMPKIKKTLPNYLSKEEVNCLLDIELKDHYSYRNKAMLELMYATGLRTSELLQLKIHDINIDYATIRIMGKGRKERIVPIADYALHYFKLYLDFYRNIFLKRKQSDYVFLNNRGERMTRQAFFKIVKKLALEKHIHTDISPHILRHSFATHMIENGADIRSVQELLGHASVSTTQVYTTLSNQFVEKSYNHYHPHGNKKE